MDPRALRTLRGRGASLCAAALLASSALAVLPTTNPAEAANRLPAAARGASEAKAAVLDNYNARFDYELSAKSGRANLRTEVSLPEIAAEKMLAGRVPTLVVERDEMTQLPVMVGPSAPGYLMAKPSAKAGGSPERAAMEFLRANKSLYKVTDAELASLAVRYVTSPEGGATIVKYDQFVGGVQLFDTELAVMMSKQNEVVLTGGRVYPDVAAARTAATRFARSVPESIVPALLDLTARQTSVGDFALLEPSAPGGYQVYEYTPDRSAAEKLLGRDIRVKPYLFPIGVGEFEAGYYMELWADATGAGPVFSYVISAETGQILFRNNLTCAAPFSYRIYADSTAPFRPWDGPTGPQGTPHPNGVPDSFQASFVTQNDIVIDSAFGIVNHPWLAAGAIDTQGNNTDAYADLGGGDGFQVGTDVRGTVNGGVGTTFHYTFNPVNPPTDATNRQAAVVGMFHQVNWLHDLWYRHGFTEGTGVAQTDNFGLGGVGNDRLLAEGQDSSGLDNANMSTPADGASPRMQMFVFSAGGNLNPRRDGTFDMLIVGHEMGHYISNRLIGNASGLGNNQGRSMGEGWGDFICDVTTAQPTDDLDGTYAIGGYTDLFAAGPSFMTNYYWSIRHYPYSSRLDRNPYTFIDIGPLKSLHAGVPGNTQFFPNLISSPAEVHNAGEIWAQMLWEGYVGLAKAHGQLGGHDKIMQYMIDGMKVTPTGPTYVQARTAVTAAAAAANGFANPKDAQILWQAFAKRGIGEGAVAPTSGSTNHAGVTESFVAPLALPDDTVGLQGGGAFFLQNVHFGGTANLAFPFGAASMQPLAGNWDGATGGTADTIGGYDTGASAFFLRTSNTPGNADLTFTFGAPNPAHRAIAGDWDGNGTTTVGIYVPSTGTFFLTNTNAVGGPVIEFTFGAGGAGLLPVAGDWNNDGTDSVGFYDPSNGAVFLTNTNGPGAIADFTFTFGAGGGGLRPIAGDWNSDGTDTLALYSPTGNFFFLRNGNSAGPADDIINFGFTGAQPVAGNFDAQ